MQNAKKHDALGYGKFFIRFTIAIVIYCVISDYVSPAAPLANMQTKAGEILSVYSTYIGMFIFVYLPVLLIYMIYKKLFSRDNPHITNILSNAISPTLIICAILLYGASYAANSSATPTIKTSVTLQPSNGLTENDFSMQMLSSIEEWSKGRVLENSKKAFVSQGFSADQFKGKVRAESNYLSMSGKKLGVVNLSVFSENSDQAIVKMVRVFGFVDDGIATVSCMRQSDEKIPITFGPCGEKLKEVFNLSF